MRADTAVVQDGAAVGDGCRLGPHVVVAAGARLGERVTVEGATLVPDGVVLEDDVYVGANAVFAPVRPPRRGRSGGVEPITVREGASIGPGATVQAGVEVGAHAVVEAGAVVTSTVPRDAIVSGNPARIVGYVDADRHEAWARESGVEVVSDDGRARTAVRGVTLHRAKVVRDLRGSLIAGEVGKELPFVPQRYFYIFDVPGTDVRGEHAHRECHQFLIPIHGSLHVVADDGERRQEFVLSARETGLYLPPMVWALQYRYAPGSILLVLASHPYDPDDYIRDYNEFLREVRTRRASA